MVHSGISTKSLCIFYGYLLCDVLLCFQLKDAGMLQSYSFSHSDISSLLETQKEEELLSKLISFMEYLKVSLIIFHLYSDCFGNIANIFFTVQ
jgi:hypothetical protein